MVTPARKIAPLPEMGRLIWRRQYRGLLYHRGVHPSDHPRQLISRATGWDGVSVNGLCRWCGTPTANLRLTWHTYCFNALPGGHRPEARTDSEDAVREMRRTAGRPRP